MDKPYSTTVRIDLPDIHLAVMPLRDAGEHTRAERLTAFGDAVAELIAAADCTADLLHEYGAPTRPQRQEVIARLRAAVARVQGEG